jgi:hypothetical protein
VIGTWRGSRHVPLDLGEELFPPRVGVAKLVGADVVDDVSTPFGEVLDPGAHPVGVHCEAQHVDGRREEVRGGSFSQHIGGGVRGY